MLFSLLFLILMFAIQLRAVAQSEIPESSEPKSVAVALPTPLEGPSADSALQRAYADTFNALKERDSCSEFYGGPEIAITVLNEFFTRLKTAALPEEVALSMRGKSINVFNIPSKASFRLFEKNLVNLNGAFYQRKRFSPEHQVPNIGSFAPATRSARALSLLHELGHLIRSSNGQWLLPDDGDDAGRSRRNTQLIEKVCNKALRALN